MNKQVMSATRNGISNTMSGIASMTNSLTKNNAANKHQMYGNNIYHSQPIIANNQMIINNNHNNPTNAKYYINNNEVDNYRDSSGNIGINLCEKQWFYALLIGLAAIAVFNLGITFWIIHILKLNDTGLGFGAVVLTKQGIHVDRDLTIDGTLYAKQIKTTDPKETLTFDSLSDEKLVLKNSDVWENSLTLGDGKLEVQSNSFQIRSTNPMDLDDNVDDILFNVEPQELTLHAKEFLRPALGGHNINTSLETKSIRGDLYHDLRLESRTQSVLIEADKDIHLESRGGDIMSQSYDNTILTANEAIRMQTKRLEFRNLPLFDKTADEINAKDSYQLCICESGQLFAVRPDSVCKADAHWCSVQTNDQ